MSDAKITYGLTTVRPEMCLLVTNGKRNLRGFILLLMQEAIFYIAEAMALIIMAIGMVKLVGMQ